MKVTIISRKMNSVPQASLRAQELASNQYSNILLQCSSCLVSGSNVTIYDTGSGSVASCENKECYDKAMEIVDAKSRVNIKMPVSSTSLNVSRTNGDIESGFVATMLSYSYTHERFIVKVMKTDDNSITEKSMFVDRLASLNKGTVITISPNRFVDEEFVSHMNSIAGFDMFVM